ncbi:unnamed protein product [Cylindrotheca closterium]|uniref:peptidylprolyl isomerase n=1 Tax=Cylindrotheca closterium TaxID=2856 RepID=A0AAD2PVD6_9STRA|nr:unnamed protein product [Cylindrotheca closterium]
MAPLSCRQTGLSCMLLLCAHVSIVASLALIPSGSPIHGPVEKMTTMMIRKDPSTAQETRRRWLSNGLSFLGTSCIVPLIVFPNVVNAAATVKDPLPESIATVVLVSPSSRLGVQLMDVDIGNKVVAAVKSTEPEGMGATNGLQEGMIAIGSKETSKDIVQQIKYGPYPVVLQFYNLAREMEAPSAAEGLKRFQEKQKEASVPVNDRKEASVSFSGAGLGTKTIRKGTDCELKVRRGDTVKIRYEARVASPGGPIYDSTQDRGGPVTFTLGNGKALNGVEIGMGGMCTGEVRDLDIPSGLGYGRFGSEYYDIPGDVRLWWRVELLQLEPGDMKFR